MKPGPPAVPSSEVTVNAGETATAAACINDLDGETLAYSAVSSDTDVATLSVLVGTVTVTARRRALRA